MGPFRLHSTDTEKPSLPSVLTHGALDWRRVRKIQPSSFGTLLAKQVYSGVHCCFSNSNLLTVALSLRGHRDQVTSVHFIANESTQPSTSSGSNNDLLLTTSKDTFMKLWDLSTQHCIQTVVAHRSEIWSLDLDLERDLILTGAAEGELKAWKIDREAISAGLKETEFGEVCPQSFIKVN